MASSKDQGRLWRPLVHLGLLLAVLFLLLPALVPGPSGRRPRRPGEPVPFVRALWFFLFLFWPVVIAATVGISRMVR